jgi:hypothetical protein
VLADAPKHYWRLADPGGSIAYDLGSAPVPLTARNYLAQGGYSGPNSDGGAFFFTAAAAIWDYDGESQTVPVSVEALCYQSLRAARIQVVVDTELTTVSSGLGLGIDATGHFIAFASGALATNPAVTPTGHWHHLVATHTGTQMKLYVDAINVATVANVLASPYTSGLSIGARASDFGVPFEGFISEVAIYNATLTPTQVNNHFLQLPGVLPAPIYKLLGAFAPSTGTSTFDAAQLASILAAVTHTFPTT